LIDAELKGTRLTFNAGTGDDTVDAASLSDFGSLVSVAGDNGNDSLIGGPGQDILDGERGENRLVQN
jgi:Ca2+-binding RTX toxin-like protein